MEISKAWDLLTAKVMGWVKGFILVLPNLLVAVFVLLVFWLVAPFPIRTLDFGITADEGRETR